MGFQLVGRQRKACFHRGYPCVDNQSDGDSPQAHRQKGRKADRRLGKQGLEPSGEERQDDKRDGQTDDDELPMMIHSIKFMISVGYTLLFYKQKVLVGSIESVNS